MSTSELFYCLPSGQYYGSWRGDPDTDRNEYAERGYIEAPYAPESTRYFWDAENREFYLPPLAAEEIAADEREWRDRELASVAWLRERHRDQVEIGGGTTLTAEQFQELLVYMQALRDWPQSEQFPVIEHRPVVPSWIVGQG